MHQIMPYYCEFPSILLTTLFLMHFFGGGSKPSLLSPRALRMKAEEELADSEALPEVLAVIGEAEALAASYVAFADESLTTYRDRTSSPDAGIEELIEVLTPIEDLRREKLERLIELRGALGELLSDREWHVLFG